MKDERRPGLDYICCALLYAAAIHEGLPLYFLCLFVFYEIKVSLNVRWFPPPPFLSFNCATSKVF